MIDTILAVGFAAATLAAVSADDEEAGEDAAVSVLGVGTATTAAFIASAAHGHNSIQSCLAQRNAPAGKVPTRVAQRPALVSPASYVASVSAAAP